MDINEIRLNNLLILIERFRTDKEFCEAVGISATYLPQVKAGTKRLGEVIARRIENAMGLEHGWLDQVHTGAITTPALDIENIAALHALETLPAPLRDTLRRLLFLTAGLCHPLPEAPQDVAPFRFTNQPEHPEVKKNGTQ